MYRKVLFAASLMLAPTAQAQTPGQNLLNNALADFRTTGTSGETASGRVDAAPTFRITGERALRGQVDGSESQSSFRAEVRGDVVTTTWGEAEFGPVQNPDRSSGAFVVSLGTCSQHGAILFTRRTGAPLHVGAYRISAGADGANEILALVITGRPTKPTGAFHGRSGWLVVTAASDALITGRFQVDAIGFMAAEPQREDRHVNVTGSLSAIRGNSSFGVCEEAE